MSRVSYYEVPSGAPTTLEDLVQSESPTVLFVGEVHERPWLVEELVGVLDSLCRRGLLGFLALEHFNIEQQGLLDEWARGGLSWEELVEEYSRGPEGFNLLVYKPLLEKALHCGARIAGIMVPRSMAQVVSREGRIPWLPRGAPDPKVYAGYTPYRSLLESLFPREGPMARIPVERLVLAQSYKDSIAAWALARLAREKPGVVVMGWVHVEARGGVATRTAALVPGLRYLVVGYREDGVGEILSWYREWAGSLETRVVGVYSLASPAG